MTYDEAVAYLDSLTNFERTHQPRAMREVRLGRMRRLCQRLGDPQRSFRSILVAGTNGKGSICAMLYSILRESSLRVGLYTSPHLEHLRERVRVWTGGAALGERAPQDDWVGEEEFAGLVERIRPIAEEMRRGSRANAPTYFEVLTALAFACFRQRRVEVAVLEVGLGGRLDATNVAEQAVSVIAPIDMDHADVLGNDPIAIAKEKIGIIKNHQPVIAAPQRAEVGEVLQLICEAQGVPLWRCGRELTVGVSRHTLEGLELCVTGARGIYESLQVPLLGLHQASNAAVAVGAVEALSGTGIPHGIVERGLSRVEWPGRLEVIHESPLVLLDGAHNPHAAAALAETLTELCQGKRIHILIGMSGDKAVEEIGARLGPCAESITCTKSAHPRALDPGELAGRLRPYCPEVQAMADPLDACTYLLNTVRPDDALVVTGSLFLVGEVRAALRKSPWWNRRAVAVPV